jgi:methyl-accepting chemotaxis protein
MTRTIQPVSLILLHESEKNLTINKLKANRKKKSDHIALLLKVSIISIICVLVAVIVISIFSIHSMETTGIKPAVNIGINKLNSDMVFFVNKLSTEYGQLRLIDGDLIGQEGVSLKNNYKLVDDISSYFGIEATVFVRNGNDYRRISTSIVDNAGKRVVDTFLETDNAAYQRIQDGNDYIGKDVILGKNYITKYRPIFTENGKEVIGILFIGKDMTAIEEVIKTNIVQYKKRMTVITVTILLASVVLFGLGYKYKFLSRKAK